MGKRSSPRPSANRRTDVSPVISPGRGKRSSGRSEKSGSPGRSPKVPREECPSFLTKLQNIFSVSVNTRQCMPLFTSYVPKVTRMPRGPRVARRASPPRKRTRSDNPDLSTQSGGDTSSATFIELRDPTSDILTEVDRSSQRIPCEDYSVLEHASLRTQYLLTAAYLETSKTVKANIPPRLKGMLEETFGSDEYATLAAETKPDSKDTTESLDLNERDTLSQKEKEKRILENTPLTTAVVENFNLNHVVMSFSVMVEGLQDGLNLATFYYFKNAFALSPTMVSICGGVILIPWIVKPIFAYITDTTFIDGERRRPFIVAGNLVAAASYLGVGLAASIHSLPMALVCLSMSNLGRALALSSLQGLVAESGTGKHAISEFYWLRAFGSLIAAYYGGVLMESYSAATVLTLVGLMPASAGILCATFLKEDSGHIVFEEGIWEQLWESVKNPVFYGPLLYLIIYCSGPNYDDALYFYYVNELGFSPEFMGRISWFHAVARLVGISFYRVFLRDMNPRTMVVISSFLAVPLYCIPALITSKLYLQFGLPVKVLALGGEMIRDAFLYVQLMPALDAGSRIGPAGLESTVFSLVTALGNVGRGVSRVTSAAAITGFGVTAYNFDHLTGLTLFCGSTLLLPLAVLPYIEFGDEKGTANSIQDEHKNVVKIDIVETGELPQPSDEKRDREECCSHEKQDIPDKNTSFGLELEKGTRDNVIENAKDSGNAPNTTPEKTVNNSSINIV